MPRGADLIRWAAMWVRHRVEVRVQRQRIRLKHRLGLESGVAEPERAPAGAAWHAEATPPGWSVAMPWGESAVHPRDPADGLFREAMEHRFRILAPEPVSFARADPGHLARMAKLATELPPAAVDSYVPIEWHADVRHGYRWDPAQLYIDVRLAPLPGADIKVPRELSRFNHVGALARGPGDDGGVEFALQLLDWIVANPYGRGPNWACTMDVALRSLNWIWGLRFFEPLFARSPRLLHVVRRSLRQHGAHIETHLEYYEELTNNHYLSDIAGLMHIAAAFPEFPESDRWLRFCLQELVSEMDREVLPDGYSHEASTHYHRLVAELFASCAALAERLPGARRRRLTKVDVREHRVRPPLRDAASAGLNLEATGTLLPPGFHARLLRMAEFTRALTKPNGLVPQIGDNDSGRAHKLLGHCADERDHRHLVAVVAQLCGTGYLLPEDARARAEARLVAGGIAAPPRMTPSEDPPGVRRFPDAGIAVLRNSRAWLAVSCGPNGLHGRGGHGHNDKLSFELNVDEQDFIVDGGCPAYTGDPALRNRFRGTAAHSTIAIDGREQDPVPQGMAGLFRLPQRCNPRLESGQGLQLIGSHDGYGTVHERRFTLEENRLVIDDRFASAEPRTLRFNLDPAVEVRLASQEQPGVDSIVLEASGVVLSLRITGATGPRVVDGCFGLGFGVPVATRALELRITAAAVRSEIAWT